MDEHATSPAEERVISVIPNATLMGGFLGIGSRLHTIIVTNERVIFARTTTQMLKDLVAEARGSAKAEGKGFMGQWGAQMTAGATFAERYWAMSPAETLAEYADNFAIDRSSIKSAKLKGGTAGDANTAASADQLVIKTTERKKYKVSLGAGMRQAREALIAAELI